jgi:hypothetical protein
MQKQTLEQPEKRNLKVLVSALAIALATNAVIFNTHHGSKQQVTFTRDDLHKIFDHERETLHAPHNYGARGRYTVILGNE